MEFENTVDISLNILPDGTNTFYIFKINNKGTGISMPNLH